MCQNCKCYKESKQIKVYIVLYCFYDEYGDLVKEYKESFLNHVSDAIDYANTLKYANKPAKIYFPDEELPMNGCQGSPAFVQIIEKCF